jgi:hypothetical protein
MISGICPKSSFWYRSQSLCPFGASDDFLIIYTIDKHLGEPRGEGASSPHERGWVGASSASGVILISSLLKPVM